MSALPLMLLHGWGAHAGVWSEVIGRMDLGHTVIAPDYPADRGVDGSVNEVLDRLAGLVPEACVVAGWSLGGQLALQLALRYPRRIRKLILVSTTPRFVTTEDWTCGMDKAVFSAFADSLPANPGQALRRFLLLQTQGDAQARAVVRKLEILLSARPDLDEPALLQTLDWLRDTDLRAVLPEVAQPALVMHGDCDRITPLSAGEYLAAQLADASLECMAGAAHVPFVSDPDAFSRRFTEFCNE